jgi:hypothetical protein
MAAFESREAVAGKVEWEGGLELSLEYGLKPTDMPEGDDELRIAWSKMLDAWKNFQEAAQPVAEMLGLDDS